MDKTVKRLKRNGAVKMLRELGGNLFRAVFFFHSLGEKNDSIFIKFSMLLIGASSSRSRSVLCYIGLIPENWVGQSYGFGGDGVDLRP